MQNNMYIMEEMIQNRKVREVCISKYTAENQLLTQQIIKEFNLTRIDQKYVQKSRDYTENSYSRMKIMEEEINYLLCIWIYEPFVHLIEKQYLLATHIGYVEKYENVDIDNEIYMQLSLLASVKISDTSLSEALLQRSEVYRFDILNEILEAKEARTALIKALEPTQMPLVNLLVEKYNLKWIDDKYLKKVNAHDTSPYGRCKMKEEEIFFIKKALLFINWANSMEVTDKRFNDINHVYNFHLYDLDHILQYRNKLTKIYFSMFEDGTLPMNQGQVNILKAD